MLAVLKQLLVQSEFAWCSNSVNLEEEQQDPTTPENNFLYSSTIYGELVETISTTIPWSCGDYQISSSPSLTAS